MSKQTIKPSIFGCKKALFHKWNYSSYWNGNERRVLPWWEGTTGVGRSGYRCYNCGKFSWDLSDYEYEATMAVALGVVRLPKPGEIHCD